MMAELMESETKTRPSTPKPVNYISDEDRHNKVQTFWVECSVTRKNRQMSIKAAQK